MALSLLRKSPLLLMRFSPQSRLTVPNPRLIHLTRLLSAEPPKGTGPTKPQEETQQGPIKLPQRKGATGQNRTPMSWKSLGVTVVVFGVLLQVLWYFKKVRQEETDKKKVMSLGKAAIGGGFELIDTARKTVSDKDFLGKWVLIYFGFTHCPDICPEELEKMAVVIENIDKSEKADPMQPLFISVDPERDTPEVIAKYTVDFSPKLLGLTGTVDQVKDICKKYRIYYSAGPKEDGDYIVDHTIIMYLLNPKGEFTQYYGRNKNAADITRDIIIQMAKFKNKNA